MNRYDCLSIDNASHACAITGNLIGDIRRIIWRDRQYLKLLKGDGNDCASTLHRNEVDFRDNLGRMPGYCSFVGSH